MLTKAIKLRVLLFHDGGWWVAQCLEHDICVQGTTIPDVEAALRTAIEGHLALSMEQGEAPFAGIPPAPDRFLQVYEHLSRHIDANMKPLNTGVRVIEPELRVA